MLTFGIYPGGVAGGDSGLLSGLPDLPDQVESALSALQGDSAPLVVRCYDSFQDPDSPYVAHPCAPKEYPRYAVPTTRPMELVLQYRSAAGNVQGYLDFVRARIVQHAPLLYAVQITEEANFTDGPAVIDGPYPDVCRALIEGVQAAKETLRSIGRTHVKIGFNSTPTFGPSADFWTRLSTGGERFVQSLDYVGLDFFPDVFHPVTPDGEPGDLKSSVVGVLETMRSVWLPSAGIPERVAIHITEHGWPTFAGHSVNRQAEVIERVVRTIHELSERLNVQRYTLFALRDVALSTRGNEGDLFSFFGIMTADYQRKPAFDVLRRLVQEFGAARSR